MSGLQEYETRFLGTTTRQVQVRFEDFEVRDVEAALELAFFVDAALDFDALLVEPTPVAAFLAVPLLVLDLTFFSAGSFLPAYVFLRAESDLVVEVLPDVFGGLAGGTCFLTVLVDDKALGGDVFEEGALRPLEGFVVADLPVTVFVLDPGLVAGFGTVFVEVLEVFEAGLFSFASSATLGILGASLTRPDGPLGSEKVFFSAPTAMALLSWVFCAFPMSSLYFSPTNFLIWGRETPTRASSGWAAMHSLIISVQLG